MIFSTVCGKANRRRMGMQSIFDGLGDSTKKADVDPFMKFLWKTRRKLLWVFLLSLIIIGGGATEAEMSVTPGLCLSSLCIALFVTSLALEKSHREFVLVKVFWWLVGIIPISAWCFLWYYFINK